MAERGPDERNEREFASVPQGPDGPSLGRRAVRGAAVTMAAQTSKIGLQVLSVVFLARLLDPDAYGLIAMVMAIVGVAEIFRDFGLSSAAIQSPTLSRAERDNLFWLSTLLGMALGIITFAAAPLVSVLFGQPALTAITMVLAVNFLLNGLATQYRADLTRRLYFRKIAVADVVSPALGLVVAIFIALVGGGYWSLVAQQIVQAGAGLIIMMVSAGWLPKRYRRDVPVRRFMQFGVRLAASQLVGYIGSNVDTITLGLTVSPGQLGLYNRAYQLIMTPLGQIRAPLGAVAIPVLARAQHDEARYESFVIRGQIALGYSVVAGLAIVAGVASPLIDVLLGSQWEGAKPALFLLAIGAGFQTLAYVGYWVYVSKGLVEHLLHYTILATALRVICVLIGAVFGMVGVAAAMALVPIVSWPVSFWWLSRRAAVPVRALVLGGVRVMLLSAVVGGMSGLAVFIGQGQPDWLILVLGVLSGAASYAVLVWLVPAFRRDLSSAWSLIQTHLLRSRAR